MTNPVREDMPYRACVGVMLLNGAGQAWIGRRIPKWSGDKSAQLWQMPQGGIDDGESPEEAALRELEEETGASKGTVIGRTDDWLYYDLPDGDLGIALKGKYRGQKQHWFAIRFEGSDDDFNLSPADHKPEFDAWRWEELDELPGLIVPFKRPVYEQVVRLFKPLTRSG